MKHINNLFIIFLILLLTGCTNQPQFEELTYATDFTEISALDGRTWQILYENREPSTYDGIVRHTSGWVDASVPFMSHDILMTTRDYADPEITKTMVFQHKFFYRSDHGGLSGRINLIHALPASLEIYEQLQQIDKWDHVIINGREILMVKIFDAEGKDKGYFKDMGCNTLLITGVTIIEPQVSAP
ncbi:MAG: hypothetical protein JEZ00_15520 [Anaerolineaceae bacterium]|nr:hypothetical protein [Anaerolineaceae bacterium]